MGGLRQARWARRPRCQHGRGGAARGQIAENVERGLKGLCHTKDKLLSGGSAEMVAPDSRWNAEMAGVLRWHGLRPAKKAGGARFAERMWMGAEGAHRM